MTSSNSMKKTFWSKSKNRCSYVWKCRSSRPEVFCKKCVLGNFVKFAGKHQCQRFFFNKVAGLLKLTIKTPKLRQWRHFGVFIVNFERPVTLLTKSLWRMCFPVNFAKFLRTPFFTDQLRWMFLKMRSLLLTYYQFSIPSSSY